MPTRHQRTLVNSGPALFARSRLDKRVAVTFLVACCAELALSGRSFDVPVVPWEVIAITWPLVPVAPAIVALRPLDTPLAFLELATGDPCRAALSRLWWCLTCVVAVGGSQSLIFLAADAVGGAPTSGMSVGIRNALGYWALGLISGWLLGVELCWVAPTLLVTSLVFFGRNADQLPRGWALLLRDSGSGPAWAVTASLAIVASALHVGRDLSLGPTTRGTR